LPQSVLGLFPAFPKKRIGGIEESARLAWDSIVSKSDAQLVSFSNSGGASRLQTILEVLKLRKQPEIVLVWHLGLLKLIPFLRKSPAKLALFLHGVETWKTHGWLTRKLLNRVDVFFSNSEFTWQEFIRHNANFSDKQQVQVSLGVGDALGTVQTSPHDPPAALMISRLATSEDYKGHREVIRAWPAILETHPRAELWIAGEGDLQNELEQLVVSLNLTAHIKFLGRVSEDHKQELLAQSHCLLMPSRGEGFGIVYLEAMRYGRPCLVSTLDAGREVVNPPEAGLAANPENQPELVQAITRLLTAGPEWERWSEQSRQRYEQNYTAERFQKRLLAALFSDQSSKESNV
jgi:phosphatidylinositol alpha-1,6-mannosyltransferase